MRSHIEDFWNDVGRNLIQIIYIYIFGKIWGVWFCIFWHIIIWLKVYLSDLRFRPLYVNQFTFGQALTTKLFGNNLEYKRDKTETGLSALSRNFIFGRIIEVLRLFLWRTVYSAATVVKETKIVLSWAGMSRWQSRSTHQVHWNEVIIWNGIYFPLPAEAIRWVWVANNLGFSRIVVKRAFS